VLSPCLYYLPLADASGKAPLASVVV
jgi:hypothetical protein